MTVAVGLGLQQMLFETPAAFWRFVDMCEEGAVDSLWQTDRIVSADPQLECMTTVAAIAGRTRRIKFGINVISVALRDPVLVAKQCATIDVLSEGRLLPGFGIGSPQAPEWAALGIDPKTRGARTDEGLEIIRRLWQESNVDFTGRHYTLKGATIAPKPIQPDLPMWIGGGSAAAVERTARIGTGWQAGPEGPEEAGRIVAAIKEAAAKHGRTIDDDHYGAGFPFHFGSPDEPAVKRAMEAHTKRTGRPAEDYFAIGDKDVIVARIADYVAHGVSKFIVRPVVRGDEAALVQTRRLIAEVLPEVARRWPKPPKTPKTRAPA